MKKNWIYLWIVVALLTLQPLYALGQDYSQTIDFDLNQAFSWNINWKHTLDQIPQGSIIQSASITLRVKVWYWGSNIYEQNIDIMASDTSSFSLPQNRVCELNPSTNPSASNFYTVTCPLPSIALGYIENDGDIYIGTNTYMGTYYIDYSTLTVSASQVEQYSLTVDVDPIQSGAVTLNPPGQIYNDGQIIILSATNSSGYVFDHWTGEVADIHQAITTVTIDKNQSVVANFSSDRDSDGVKDSIDGCPDDPKKTIPSQCGCDCVDTPGGRPVPWLYLLLRQQ
ncbi:MAG: hypothetical protein KJ804_11740 [Proteobacteria bacterium]|nr:hypothetical protein [Pseudomonadota bacterium]MBU1058975.1 hypothetical protein [Pseudomonadota bacterium]